MNRSVAKEMIDGLNELTEAVRRGDDLSAKFNVREVRLSIKPSKYTPALVKKTRGTLQASQSLFAMFLGVSPATVRAWERGANTPSDMAARFMDEIRHDPQYWQRRFLSVTTMRNAGPAGARIKRRA
jgi:putative transcriptional regulator